LRECHRRLRESEERISLVLNVDEAGTAETRPLEISANSGSAAGEPRGRKRGSPSSPPQGEPER
jgi:hypothetical protein